MQEAVEHGDGSGVLGEEGAPLIEGPMAGHAETGPLVRRSDEAEEQLRTHGIERCKAELVNDDQVTAQQSVDELADGVVSEPAVLVASERSPWSSCAPWYALTVCK